MKQETPPARVTETGGAQRKAPKRLADLSIAA